MLRYVIKSLFTFQNRYVSVKTIYKLHISPCCMKLSTKHKINQRHFKISSTNNRPLHVIPQSLLSVGVSSREGLHKLDEVVDSLMSKTGCCKSIVGRPLIRMNYRPRKDPVSYTHLTLPTIYSV